MKTKAILLSLLITFSLTTHAQVAINTNGAAPDASAMLDISSTDNDKGLLIPRMTASQRAGITNPATGLLVFQTDGTVGFYYNLGTPDTPSWIQLSSTLITQIADADGDTKVQVEKTADEDHIRFDVEGSEAMAIDNSGNVGIGVTNPGHRLTLPGGDNSISLGDKIFINGQGSTGRISHNAYKNGGWQIPDAGAKASTIELRNSGVIDMYGTLTDGATDFQLMFGVDAPNNKVYFPNGNVGIGTTTPSQKLEVNGNITQTGGHYTATEQIRAIDADGIKLYDDGGNGLFVEDGGNIGIGTSNPDASALLELNSTAKGLLPPRMSASEMNTIASPADGLMVYNTTINSICFFDGTLWKNLYNLDGETCGTITYDGQTYQTVVIGIQCWMAENLNIGTRIISVLDQTDNSIIEKYCYNDNANNCDTYGGLYQWDEMMQYITTEGTQGICPTDWHLPTDDEWKTMEMYLGMSQAQADATGDRGTDEGGKLKEIGTTHWNSPNTGATNLNGFTGLPGGYRLTDGTTNYLTQHAGFWSSSVENWANAWFRDLYYNDAQVNRSDLIKAYGFSVRCVRD